MKFKRRHLVMIVLAIVIGISVHNVFLHIFNTNRSQITKFAINCDNPNDNARIIFNQLVSKLNLTNNQAAGVLGNIMHESDGTFSPFVHEYSMPFEKGGYGIVQWTGYRRYSKGMSNNVVSHIKKTVGDELFEEYYKDYGRIANNCTPKGISQEINEKFLNAQIDFLVEELTVRHYGFMTFFNNLKKTQTIDEASDLWLKYYEAPTDPDSSKNERRKNAHKMYDLYAN